MEKYFHLMPFKWACL